MDRLSDLFDRFRMRAHLFHSGRLCGIQDFEAVPGRGFLHILRQGALEVREPGPGGRAAGFSIDQPSLLFYPRARAHQFRHRLQDGSDFTCASIEFEEGDRHPLVRALPNVLVVPLDAIDGLDDVLRLLFAETDRVRCGHRLVADKLFEVAMIQLLRWAMDHPERLGVERGLIHGFADPQLAKALTAMHAAPGEAWSLASLASAAGMSRTAFTSKFRRVLDTTPAQYLADWRIAVAKQQLDRGRRLNLIANELGYANATALSRVFRERVGVSPRDWLARQREAS